MYTKIVKIIMWALIAISVAILGWGVFFGLTKKDALPIDIILYWAYALVAIAVVTILVLGVGLGASRMDKKALIKSGCVLGGIAIIVIVVALTAKGTLAEGLVGIEQTEGEFKLKLTDAVLTLTYISCGAAIAAILFSAILGAIRNGK